MAVIAPTLVFRTFPTVTTGEDGAPVIPSAGPEPLVSSEMLGELMGKLPFVFGDVSGEDSDDYGAPGGASGGGGTGPAGPTGATGASGTSGAPGINGEDGENGLTILLPSPARTKTIGVTFDGDGSPPTIGSVGYVVCQDSGTIDQWAIIADVSGSAVVDVWKVAGAIPTNANTIAGSEKLTLSAQQLANDTSLTTWSTPVSSGDVFGFELESVSTCTRLTCEVRITLTH
jgi:hypothetical protein